MVYAFVQDVPIGEEMYRRITDNLGPEPMAGLLCHLCVRRPDGRLRYIDVWESKEACGRVFDERIHPAVDAAFGGSRPGTNLPRSSWTYCTPPARCWQKVGREP